LGVNGKLKNKVYYLIEASCGSRSSRIFDSLIMLVILMSVVEIVLESFSEFETNYHLFFIDFELFAIIIFSVEYLLRIYVADITYPGTGGFRSRLKFMTSTYGVIDLLAILPAFVPLFFALDFRFLRLLRLIRLITIFKLNRYTASLRLIGQVIKERLPELGISLVIIMVITLITAILMHFAENEAQPDKFPNVIASLWWSIITLTTVGYGDIYPVTNLGKLIAGTTSILSIGFLALPAGIISSGFIDKLQKHKLSKCPHCGKKIE